MGYTKTNKQTKITAESAVGTAKSSPKEKRCHKSNLLQDYDRFRFRVNSGFQRKGGPVGFLVLLLYFSHYCLGLGFFPGYCIFGELSHFFPGKENIFTAKQLFSSLLF